MDADLGLALNLDLGGEFGGGASAGARKYSSRDRFEHRRAKKFARVKGKPLPIPPPRRPFPPPPPPPPPPPAAGCDTQQQPQKQAPGTTTAPAAMKPKDHPPAAAKKQQQQQPRAKAAVAADDDGDRLELDSLVGLAMAREARLREEGVTGGAAADPEENGAGRGVVEFGDGDDEPDYFSPAAARRGGAGGGAGGGGGGGGGGGSAGGQQPPWRRDRFNNNHNQKHQPGGDGAPLQRHRVGQLARAAEPVPLAARHAIFGGGGEEGSGNGGNGSGDASSNHPSWSAERHAPPALRAKLAQNPEAPVAWHDLGLASSLSGHLEQLNFAKPTKVQRLAVPCLLARRDALVRAATGSGKTLAYLAPIVHDLVSNGSFLPSAGGGAGKAGAGAGAGAASNGNGNGNGPPSSPSPNPAAHPRRLSRSEGTYAVVLAPTRELAVQIGDVLSAVLRRYPWVVSGLLVGGENRAHEKARLRKGVAALVATPGRLLDHLENTASFSVAPLRWFVLDEADRLLDMGFESKVREILALAEGRRRQQVEEAAMVAAAAGGFGGASASAVAAAMARMPRRTTALLSATLHSRLRALAELSLDSPAAIGFDPSELLKRLDGGGGGEGQGEEGGGGGEGGEGDGKAKGAMAGAGEWEMPETLRQSVVEVPARDRLAALVGALRTRLEDAAAAAAAVGKHNSKKKPTADAATTTTPAVAKIVVFLSTCDGVEFHHALLTSPHIARSVTTGEGLGGGGGAGGAGGGDGSAADGGYGRLLQQKKQRSKEATSNGEDSDNDPYHDGVLGRGVAVLRLHGDMPQAERTSSFLRFAAAGTPSADANARGGAVLLCTDVAARGLDFPSVTAIVQYDPPGDPADYVHRVGRTARMGQRGEALLFSLPSERAYGDLLRERSDGRLELKEAPLEPLLRRCLPPAAGAGGRGGLAASSYYSSPSSFNTGAAAAGALTRRAAAAVAADARLAALAADAFRSFVRAYATHPSALKPIFHVRSLHLGHVASAFALREPPAQLGASGSREERKKRKREEERREKKKTAARMGGGGGRGRGGGGGGRGSAFSLE
jgi:ATP-dependent RNA helicase DDX31/DBP7